MPGLRLKSFVTYQGLPCVGCSYQRSEGFQANVGYVDIDMVHLKSIRIEPRTVPWRAVNGNEINGQLSINAWYETRGLFPSGGSPPPIKAPAGQGGLNEFGDLVMKTIDLETGSDLSHPLTYHDIYVDDTGIEELAEDLLKARAHSSGVVRVPITDIRKVYQDNGALIARINVRLRSGGWDKGSIKKPDTGEPWLFLDVVEFLFSQLPGSPIIESWAELREIAGGLPPPTDIIGEGEPVVDHLSRILEKNGLVVHMLPVGNFLVSQKLSGRLKPGKVPMQDSPSPGRPPYVEPSEESYEKRTVTISRRPPAILALGKKRVRRVTMGYVPVIQLEDNRWYLLQDGVAKMRYSMDKVNKFQLRGFEKRFQDVEPTNNASVHLKRRKALERAYHIYAPASLFYRKFDYGDSIADPDFETMPFLPVQNAGWMTGELGIEGVAVTQGEGETEGKVELGKNAIVREGGGSGGRFVIMPPIVKARRIGTGFFKDFSKVEEYFSSLD